MANKDTETIFSIDTSGIKYGEGATSEVGYELDRLGVKNAIIITDPYLRENEAVKKAFESIEYQGIKVTIYDKVEIEPTDKSFKHAIEFCINRNLMDLLQ